MTHEDAPTPHDRPADIRAEVVQALAASNLPEEIQQEPSGRLLGVELRAPSLPPLLERGLAQTDVTTTELWVRAIVAETTIKYLERDLERLAQDNSNAIARLETRIAEIAASRWSEGKVLALLALIVGLAVGLAKLVGIA
jgi:hypothetical protein